VKVAKLSVAFRPNSRRAARFHPRDKVNCDASRCPRNVRHRQRNRPALCLVSKRLSAARSVRKADQKLQLRQVLSQFSAAPERKAGAALRTRAAPRFAPH
jgi:hypothetical protein